MKSDQLPCTLGVFTLDLKVNWLELHCNAKTSYCVNKLSKIPYHDQEQT